MINVSGRAWLVWRLRSKSRKASIPDLKKQLFSDSFRQKKAFNETAKLKAIAKCNLMITL